MAAVVLGLIVLVIVVAIFASGSPKTSPRQGSTTNPATTAGGIPAVEAGLLPWTLNAALSREVVLPGSGTSLTVVGGLDAAQRSVAGVYTLDTATGMLTAAGELAAAVHDAAGARMGGQDFLFGGGSPTTIADVESFVVPQGAGGGARGSVIGQLPQPRSDGSAVTIGGTAYVVGGYDGAKADGQVLSTTDGRHFSVVTSLPVPVRYAAVAALDNRIYLFGGQAVGGQDNGAFVDAVQMVDPSAGTAKVVARMPQATAGAMAAVLGGHLYVAGGATQPAAGTGASSGAGAGASTGEASGGVATATGGIYAFDAAHAKLLGAGTLPAPVAYGAVAVVGARAWVVGGERGGTPVSSVEMFTPNRAFGSAGAAGAGSPYFGARLLVADRGNDRLLLLDDTNQIVWTYPSATTTPPAGGFYFPDDAFFAKKGTEIVSNQEQNETIVIIAYPSGKILWEYGHPLQAGTAPGYLHEPDDAYLLKNGQITVADAQGCRVLVINPDKTVAQQIGTDNVCTHKPPGFLGSPNGDTPLANGNLLVSEINGSWVTEYSLTGQLLWTVHVPVGYPSDPQQVGPDLYLLSDYSHPGAIVEFNREGQVLYRYQVASGPGALDHPSLTEQLPSGVFLSNDDYRHRLVAIDPATQALVWQYGVTDKSGTAPGMLNMPDGFDLLMPDGSTPTHPTTG